MPWKLLVQVKVRAQSSLAILVGAVAVIWVESVQLGNNLDFELSFYVSLPK